MLSSFRWTSWALKRDSAKAWNDRGWKDCRRISQISFYGRQKKKVLKCANQQMWEETQQHVCCYVFYANMFLDAGFCLPEFFFLNTNEIFDCFQLEMCGKDEWLLGAGLETSDLIPSDYIFQCFVIWGGSHMLKSKICLSWFESRHDFFLFFLFLLFLAFSLDLAN